MRSRGCDWGAVSRGEIPARSRDRAGGNRIVYVKFETSMYHTKTILLILLAYIRTISHVFISE